MAEGDGYYVDGPSVTAVAGRAEAIGDAIARSGDAAAGPLDAAVSAHNGTLAAIALAHLHRRWHGKLGTLGADSRDVGARLHGTVADYGTWRTPTTGSSTARTSTPEDQGATWTIGNCAMRNPSCSIRRPMRSGTGGSGWRTRASRFATMW